MPGFHHTPALLALLFALATLPAYADESGLDGYAEPAAPVQSPQPVPEPAPSVVDSPAADDNYVPPPVVVLHPKESPRFTAEERERLRHWLIPLCRQDAVAPEVSNRVKFGRESARTELVAGNKQGSLILLLDSYSELAAIRDGCVEKRKTDPAACIEKGRLPKPTAAPDLARYPWMKIGSSKFWSEVNSGRTPAGIEKKTDLLRETDAQVKDLSAVLKKEFFDFRDAADLGGKPGSGATARQLAEDVRQLSTCKTRAVPEHPHSQK